MKLSLKRIAVLLIMFAVMAAQATPSDVVNIPDDNLKKALNNELGRGEVLADITEADMDSLSGKLSLGKKNITDITGLEYLTRVSSLSLESNNISDVSPLSGLTKLYFLGVGYNKIVDISPLKPLLGNSSIHISAEFQTLDIPSIITHASTHSIEAQSIIGLDGNEISYTININSHEGSWRKSYIAVDKWSQDTVTQDGQAGIYFNGSIEQQVYYRTKIIINFEPNGGVGFMSPQETDSASAKVVLKANKFTRSGYTFIGWKSNTWLGGGVGSGIAEDGQTVVVYEPSITLTAQWEAEPIALLDVDEDGDITEIDDIALIRKYVLLKNSGLPDSLIASQLLLNLEWTNPKNLTTIDIIENIKKLLPLLLDVDEDGNITEIDDIALIRKYVLLKNSGLPDSLIASQLLLNLEWTNPESLTASEIITNIKKLL